jgi:hypothetical protein
VTPVRKTRLPASRSTIDADPRRRAFPFSTIREIIGLYRTVDNPGFKGSFHQVEGKMSVF